MAGQRIAIRLVQKLSGLEGEDLVVAIANAHDVFDVVCGEVPPAEQQRLDAV